jgi:hypothetical protein
MALHALSRMETRKYQSDTCSLDRSRLEESLADSTTSLNKTEQTSKCVICLEKFKNGQVCQKNRKTSMAFFYNDNFVVCAFSKDFFPQLSVFPRGWKNLSMPCWSLFLTLSFS